MKSLTALSATFSLVLTSCSHSPNALNAPSTSTVASASGPTANHLYRDVALGFSLEVPSDMHLTRSFQRTYLDAARWKAFATPGSRGSAAAALVLNGSNKITAAELRVGVSTDSSSLAHCTDIPASGIADRRATVTLHGADFVQFHAADAAMSHYLQVEGYRGVHSGRCYAIDLWITGTRPEVYDPPATAPFSREEAARQLRDALKGFQFLD